MYCHRIAEFHREQLLFIDKSEKFWFIYKQQLFRVKFSDDLRRYIALFRLSRSLVITVNYNEEVNMKLCLNIFLDIFPFPLL